MRWRIARVLLQVYVLSLGLLVLTGALLGLAFAPVLGLLGLVCLAFYARKGFRGTGWLFGTARLADWLDMAHAGCFRDRGLLVGECPPPTRMQAWKQLFRLPRHRSLEACRLFFAALTRKALPIRISSGVHTLVCAPAGSGKNVSVVVPFLLTDPNSAIITDPKSENFKLTAKVRRAMGHTVVNLDPFSISGEPSDTFNPLDLIDTSKPEWLDDVKAIASAIVVRTGNEHEPHWNDRAESIIAAAIAWVVTEETKERHLQTVADIVFNPTALGNLTLALLGSANPLLKRLGGSIASLQGEEKGSVISTAQRHLSCLLSGPLLKHFASTSFDLRRLRDKTSVFCCMAMEYAESHSGVTRLWITAFMLAVTKGGLNERQPVNFIIDEAPVLGNCAPVRNALVRLRGYGLRAMVIIQALGQLEEMFPNGQSQTAQANFDTSVFLGGTNDTQTAEMLSKRVGSGTFIKRDHNESVTVGVTVDGDGKPGTSNSTTVGGNVSEVKRELFTLDEIMGLQHALVFSKGCPPMLVDPPRYYETKAFRRMSRKFGKVAQFVMLTRAFMLACIGVGLVALAAFVASALPPSGTTQPAGWRGHEVRGHEPRDGQQPAGKGGPAWGGGAE